MTSPITDLIVKRGSSMRSALVTLDRAGSGFLVVVDSTGKLSGVLTDGDIRRALLRGVLIDEPVERAMQADCVSLPLEADTDEIASALTGKISFVPLVDRKGCPVDWASHSRYRRYPVMEPLLDGNEMEYVQECVRSGWISSHGRFVGLFEKMMAELHDVPHALAVSNGTVALHLAMVSLGIGPGDEVIIPDFTFASSVNAIIHTGAVPVLVDVMPETWTMNPQEVRRAITKKTRAVMPVHLYGHPCQMDKLMTIAQEANLFVLEDCAEALGSRFNGRLIGTFGDAACYSFFGNKTLTTGEGGMILFRNGRAYERARMLRDHGMSKEKRYWHLAIGYNYRLTNLQAAVGVAQFERAQEIFARKRALARRYDVALSRIEGINLPPCAEWADPTCWLYTVTLSKSLRLTRDEMISRLLLNGIETRPVFYPIHEMPPYEPYVRGRSFPVTERISRSGLSLPSAITLLEEDIDAVVASIKAIIEVRRMAVAAGSME